MKLVLVLFTLCFAVHDAQVAIGLFTINDVSPKNSSFSGKIQELLTAHFGSTPKVTLLFHGNNLFATMSVLDQVHATIIQGNLSTWATTPNSQLDGAITSACTSSFSVNCNTPRFTSCSTIGTSAGTQNCPSSLDISFVSSSIVEAARVKSFFSSIVRTDPANVLVFASNQLVIHNVNPSDALVSIVNGLRSPSLLTLLEISQLKVAGVAVYLVAEGRKKVVDGELSACTAKLWWLIFLLLLLPVTVIFGKWCYLHGKESGREKIASGEIPVHFAQPPPQQQHPQQQQQQNVWRQDMEHPQRYQNPTQYNDEQMQFYQQQYAQQQQQQYYQQQQQLRRSAEGSQQ